MYILLIDDNEDYLASVKDLCLISKIESQIVCFQDAFKALNFINSNHSQIRVVFTDYNMKKYGMSGNIIAAKCVEAMVPVVICTGYEPSEIKTSYPVLSKNKIIEIVEIANELPVRKVA